MAMPRFALAALFLCSAALATACFGDNSTEEDSNLPPGAPSIAELAKPVDADKGDTFDISVKVKGKPSEQLSVAITGVLGNSFTPQNQIVITDEAGDGTFSTRYAATTVAGLETITVNVSSLSIAGQSRTETFTVFDVEKIGNVTQVGSTLTQGTGFLVAYPMVLTEARAVRKLGILHPAQVPAGPVNVQVGLYATDTATSINAIAKTTAVLVQGANEIAIPTTMLAAGKYWMVVAYQGLTYTYRSSTVEVELRYKTDHVYSQGLGDQIGELQTSDELNPYFARNFYLVLRK